MIDETVGPSSSTTRLYEHVSSLEAAIASKTKLDRNRVLSGLAVAETLGNEAQDSDFTGFALSRTTHHEIQARLISSVLAADLVNRVVPPLGNDLRSTLEVNKLTHKAFIDAINQQPGSRTHRTPIDYYFSDQA